MIGDAAAIKIGFQLHRLAEADGFELAFLEIGIDEQADRGHQSHQRRAASDALADLHITIGDDAGNRRLDHGAIQIKLRLGKRCFGGADIGRGGERRATHHCGSSSSIAGRGTRRVLRRSDRRARGIAGGHGSGQRSPRRAQFLVRHRTAASQRLPAIKFALYPCQQGFGFSQAAAGRGNLGRAPGGPRGSRIGHGAGLAITLPRLRQRRFGLRHCNARIGIIQHHQHVAGLHGLGAAHLHFGHGAGQLRRHQCGVAAHIGVVGLHPAAGEDRPIQPGKQRGDHHHPAQHPQGPRAFRIASFLARFGSEFRGCHVSHHWPSCSRKPPPSARTSATSAARRKALTSASVRRAVTTASSAVSTSNWFDSPAS